MVNQRDSWKINIFLQNNLGQSYLNQRGDSAHFNILTDLI